MQTFHIDKASSDDEYLYIDIPKAAATVQIKVTDDGIIIDVWPSAVANGSAKTCAVTFDEILEHANSEG